MKEIITNPLSTATPDSAMSPTAAVFDIGMSRSHSARMPPVNANGMPVNPLKPSFSLPNTANSKVKTSTSATGTTTCSRRVADCRFSNCPPPVVQ